MKRLSKSASDLSGCKKKTHSTSPEEEEKPIPYTTPSHRYVYILYNSRDLVGRGAMAPQNFRILLNKKKMFLKRGILIFLRRDKPGYSLAEKIKYTSKILKQNILLGQLIKQKPLISKEWLRN